MSKTLLIGRLPPPIGGVTVFVSRYMEQCIRNGEDVDIFPRGSKSNIKCIWRLLVNHYDKIIINTMSLPLLVVIYAIGQIKNVEIVDHNHSRHFGNNTRTSIFLYFFYRVKRILIVNEHLRSNYPYYLSDKILEISPFIEPTKDEVQHALVKLPSYVSNFFNYKEKIFLISAWRYIFEGGIDLYGLKRTCCLISKISKIHPDIGLVVAIGDINHNKEMLNELKKEFSHFDNIIFWDESESTWIVFSEKVIYLRPTSTDGNSISIHEALFFGAKVLASDVVLRPNGCKLFEYSSDTDYEEKILSFLK